MAVNVHVMLLKVAKVSRLYCNITCHNDISVIALASLGNMTQIQRFYLCHVAQGGLDTLTVL